MKPISNAASKAKRAGRRPALLSFDEMPEWFRRESNKWILHGYRPISGSALTSFSSWSYIHNESVNIYSHLIPAVFFMLGEWYLQQYLISKYSKVTGADFIAFSIFMLTAVTCLSLSATYHTLMNHSQHVEHFCLRLDMLDWNFRDVDDLYDDASQVPRLEVSQFPSFDVRGDWLVRRCAFNPWALGVRDIANDDKSSPLHHGKSRLPFIWDCFLCNAYDHAQANIACSSI
ncbi:adiponectin receptor protein 1 [Nannizzia gypsea CBS 118893]|uniref:Adiponectin receptor protein 1 n=1 Tax=Arthroderma gypseum (strain ATCC MYA-4604 / CBS 118893) TaxID=535722 RepID=E4UMM6_ARTGP|nr:adiponectin receptor protein 1 [Nannizzia gypsea CBS 118893]EFQ99443.1 adiponectin receptor protein 1 [Nannizzia gypsea CBS 118893]